MVPGHRAIDGTARGDGYCVVPAARGDEEGIMTGLRAGLKPPRSQNEAGWKPAEGHGR